MLLHQLTRTCVLHYLYSKRSEPLSDGKDAKVFVEERISEADVMVFAKSYCPVSNFVCLRVCVCVWRNCDSSKTSKTKSHILFIGHCNIILKTTTTKNNEKSVL